MTRKLEDSEHTKHSEGDKRARHVVVVFNAEADIIGHDRDHVDDTHHALHERITTGRREQSQMILHGEDDYTGGVQTEKHYFIAFTTWERTCTTRPRAARHRLDHVGHH